jgi:AcrR family transcriptional regulator
MTDRNRRLEVSAAAWRVIVREGLDRASMRAIAQELGSTIGVITHHFRNKDELMLFALDQVTERLLVAMKQSVATASGLERLQRLLSVLLPTDAQAEEVLKVWLAFLGYAVGREALMQEHQRRAAQLSQLVAQELQALQLAQLVRDSIDPAVEAQALLALVNGLSIDFVIQARSLQAEQHRHILQRYIQNVLANPDAS